MRASRFAVTTFPALLALAAAGPLQAAQVTIDRTQRSQTIDGFGFFGAHDVWWGAAKDVVNTAWFDAVINDLGITAWRNEIYPPADSISGQDADWAKIKPVVQGLTDAAKASGVSLKVILTVWSPPSSMKCAVGSSGVQDGTPHPDGTKNGGGLCPSKRTDYANYLVAALKQYADIGVNVYGLSFQNEPLFVEPYNSCVYTQKEYADTLAAIGPLIHAAYPNVLLYGSENMLATECGGASGFDPYWYTANIMKAPDAVSQMGMWAVHGYTDGVLAAPTSQMSKYWASFYAGTASARLPIWMTETSGYVDTMEAGPNSSGDTLPGALDLAQAIFAALYYGHAGGWVWWQGSELGSGAPNEFDLMSSTTKRGKKYYVSKNFYRYIRPGARMVQATSDDSEVLVAAFDNDASQAFTVVAINGGKSSKTVTLTGANLPAQLQAYRTSTTEDCADVGPVTSATITLPARSITTFVTGQVVENPGTGGATGSGGVSGGGGASGKGGSSGTGGTSGTGTNGAGGATRSGGTSGEGKSSGCGCELGAASPDRTRWLLAMLSLGLLVRRCERWSRRCRSTYAVASAVSDRPAPADTDGIPRDGKGGGRIRRFRG